MSLLDYAKFPREELKRRILELKAKRKAIILAHNYQRLDVQEIADIRGDSLELARSANKTEAEMIVFCGVMFMAETAKILNPEKIVVIPEPQAGCPLAAYATAEDVLRLKQQFPEHKIVSYINSSAEVKAVSDIICTSANAVKIVNSIPERTGIIFVPDKNLCRYVQKTTARKNIVCWDGHCYVHDRFTIEDVERARLEHPEAKIIVHPEVPADVQDAADMIESTGGMYRFVKNHPTVPVVLGTEIGLIERIKYEFPDSPVFPMSKKALCSNMKQTTLEKVIRALKDEYYKIELQKNTAEKARTAIEKMLAVS